MPGRARVLLLDLDGTLSDNFGGIAASLRYALERMGARTPTDADLRACVGPPLRHSLARLLDDPQPARIEAALAHYRDRYREIGWRENEAYAGIEPALAALAAAGTAMRVCTSKPEVFARRIVTHFGFDRYVGAVYGADLEGRLDDKRALLAHLLACEALAPENCVMVGDRHHDLAAARANGTGAVGVLWGYGSHDELADADALLAAPPDLADLATWHLRRRGAVPSA